MKRGTGTVTQTCAAGQPRSGATLRVGVVGDLPNLDVHCINGDAFTLDTAKSLLTTARFNGMAFDVAGDWITTNGAWLSA